MSEIITAVLLNGAERVLERCQHTFNVERAVEAADLARAIADKQPLSGHHWQNRHRAEQRLRAAEAVVAALKDTSP